MIVCSFFQEACKSLPVLYLLQVMWPRSIGGASDANAWCGQVSYRMSPDRSGQVPERGGTQSRAEPSLHQPAISRWSGQEINIGCYKPLTFKQYTDYILIIITSIGVWKIVGLSSWTDEWMDDQASQSYFVFSSLWPIFDVPSEQADYLP